MMSLKEILEFPELIDYDSLEKNQWGKIKSEGIHQSCFRAYHELGYLMMLAEMGVPSEALVILHKDIRACPSRELPAATSGAGDRETAGDDVRDARGAGSTKSEGEKCQRA